MSTSVTKFELYFTNAQRSDPAYTTFQTSLASLTSSLFYYQAYTVDSSGNNSGNGMLIHGLLNPVNNAAALSLLVTLNAALNLSGLGSTMCDTITANTQP